MPDIPIADAEEHLPMKTPPHAELMDVYKEVDADAVLGAGWDGGTLDDVHGDNPMNLIMGILRSLGVSAADAANHLV